ncbi:kynureninase [Halomarina ordinaria]|uniref:Kynureninase n=1 Tax=Halomarina ordinaria TaxID=3033939 RepID=A0ABD5U688_9EURY|nr:kynureninase [Halomarina sp. PSRA2]
MVTDTDLAAAREEARRRDEADSLAALRERFHVPDGALYLDGNSLGPLSADAERTLTRVVEEWRERGIRGWTDADPPWFGYAEHLGERLAPLVGADPEEVVGANSTTVNIHTLVGTFYDECEGTPSILVDDLDFPTDHYAIRAQLRHRGLDPDDHLVVVESRDGRTIAEADIERALDEHDVGLVFLPSVLYRSGQLLDLPRITRAAHEHGSLFGFDLAHSVGVVPHDLSAYGVDFAVWCSYKYLNAGPGAVAGLYVNREHFGTTPALAGWWGHEKETQFDMAMTYTPAHGAGAWQTGTVPMLSAAPLEGALDVLEDAGIEAVREKSVALTDFLVDLVDEHLPECDVGTPRDPARRGGHVAVEHPDAARVSRALKARNVVVDFRRPNVVRVCPAPLYVGYEECVEFVAHLRAVLDDREYERVDARDGRVT